MKALPRFVLEFDPETGKCKVDGGVAVAFRGFMGEELFEQILVRQKERDRAEPPPAAPDDRDGVWVCKFASGATYKTWHFCTTVPPYSCANSGSRCP
jgi:hypothetical protein